MKLVNVVNAGGNAGGSGLTMMARFALPVPLPLPALIVTSVVPATIGVPVIQPLLEQTRPGGNEVVPKEVGLFVAVKGSLLEINKARQMVLSSSSILGFSYPRTVTPSNDSNIELTISDGGE